MIFIDQMKNLRIYKRPMFLPTVENDKKKKSAVLLLTPNFESSKQLIQSPMLINRMRFQSYYLEKDLSYYISGKVLKNITNESYVRESTSEELYHSLNEMNIAERNRLKDSDFGLPKKRKYPINNIKHIRSAIKFFNYVDKEDEKELAENIIKKINKFNMKVNVGEKNNFSKYFSSNLNESFTLKDLQIVSEAKNDQILIEADDYKITDRFGVISADGAYNCCIRLDKYDKLCRGRSSMIIIKDDLVFLRKNFDENITDNGSVSFPGGGWNDGEDPMDAAIRETREEVFINVKDVEYCSSFLEYHNEAQQWVKDNVEDKNNWWYGYYTKLYIGKYDSNFNNEVEEIDKDSMVETGKFYKINDVYNILDPIYKKAIDKYLNRVPLEEAGVAINTPENPELSVSAIITNKKGELLVLDHVKCNSLTIPGGKINGDESIEEALEREIFEELGIIIKEYTYYASNNFLCSYPQNGTKKELVYFRDYCYIINNYEGQIENKEPNKHKSIEWIDRADLIDIEYSKSDLLIEYLSKWYREEMNLSDTIVEALGSFILFSGYQTDIENIRKIITPFVYYNILSRDLQLKIIGLNDIPVLSIEVSNDINKIYKCDYSVMDGHLKINITIPSYEIGSLENYILSVINFIYVAILEGVYPSIRPTYLARIFADYLTGLDSKYGEIGQYLLGGDIPIYHVEDFNNICRIGDYKIIFEKLLSEDKFRRIRLTDIIDDEYTCESSSGESISMENIAKKFKYLSTTKFKKQVNTKTKSVKKLANIIKNNIETISTTPDIPHYGISDDSKEEITESSVLYNITEEQYLQMGNVITFFNEAAGKYDAQLRKLLYNERIYQRGDLLLLLKKVKEEIPLIKYAYPDIERYGEKNLFIDLYYYNELFFKNNIWTMKKGFDLYLDLLERLINDPRINKAGYIKKTVFIPVLDWNNNKSTKMWLYRENINPISIIFELMKTNSPRLKSIFKDINIVFFAKDKLFKLDFDQVEDLKKESVKFRLFINKIISNQEFDTDEVDTSFDNKEIPEVIKANLIDKIEDVKGVDLTGKDKIVKDAQKKANKDSKKSVDINRTNLVDNKSLPTKEIERNKDNLTKSADENKLKNKEADLENIAMAIDSISKDSDNTEDALEKMDKYDDIKRLLIDLDSMKDDAVKIDPVRAARMNELDSKFLDNTSIKGRSIRDILSPKEKIEDELEETKLSIASPNEEWKSLKYMNFDKDYDLQKDIIACFYHFTKVSKPIAIRNLSVNDNSTSEDRLDLYTVEVEDFKGQRFTIKLDIPKPKDNRFLLRGNEKSIQTQFFNMPIIKTDLDTCQIISNYQKIFIRRYNTSSGRMYPLSGRLLKALRKYDGKDTKISFGDNEKICNKYELPIDYIDLACSIDKIENNKATIYFNQDELREKYPNVDDSFGMPYGILKSTGEILYFRIMDDYSIFTKSLISLLDSDEKLFKLFDSAKATKTNTYSRCSILNTEIPLVVICGYCEGLTKTLQKANIEYNLVDKLTSEERLSGEFDYIKFEDGYLVYRCNYISSLLLNGLKDCVTEIYSMTDIDNKNLYLESLDNFGGRIKSDGLDNFYDCLVDPITKENLEYYKLPTDFVSILLYANTLLADNKFIKHTDSSSRRIRRTELIASYTYEALSEAYGSYANQIKHNKNGATMSLKQSTVIDKFLLSPVSSDDSIINALNAVETTNAITFKGKAGLNNDRSYSLDKRIYDDSMLNVLGMSTGFSANVGITRQATIDMNVESSRGYIKTIDSNINKLNAAKSLCATEALTPFGTTRDDAARTSMTFIQTAKHMLRTEESDPLLVTNGADEALPYITIDKFAYKAKSSGKIKEITPEMIIVEYDNGEKDYINLKETIEKNSDGGFYVPLKLDQMKGLKVGQKIQQNQILAYDKTSFSNSVGESDNISYNIGKLTKVAIINTDEGFEDSGICSESLSKKLSTRIIKKVDHTIDKNANIFKMVNIGDSINVEDSLIVWQDPYDEEEANALIKILADREAVSELGRKTIKSDISGRIADIKIYRTVELDELSDSLRKIVESYESSINNLKKKLDENSINSKDLPATYKLAPTGKLKKAQDAIYIEFYLEYTDIVAVGDKITYYSANKATIKQIIPQEDAPYTDFRPNEKIDAFVSQVSIDKRMVSSTMTYGALQKLLVELDRSIKDMLGIEYDDSKA